MRVEAPAKINLFLSVGPRRASGLHEISSVMQAVSLADDLRLDPAAGLGLSVEPPGAVPGGEDNLAMRAARALASATGATDGAALRLAKRIPVAAGLAGGSADAAAALVGLNELWGCGLSRKALEAVGAQVGSDVAFCVRGGTAGIQGTGEILAPLACRLPLWWVIAVPGAALSTAEVYARFDDLGGPGLGDPWEVADALARGDLDRLAASLRNDLEPAAEALLPGLSGAREALLAAGAVGAVQSGSGPAWMGLARDEEHAREVAARAAREFARVEVAQSLSTGARILAQ
ncbi:MAG: 4-(cytidine 5'-diphospho)-2-C-methyl-D-erythritol kinase [Acidobacteria bacterium]|nr:4-(cytidine 5'-diphospho)-2-C-methyl-D-erythritol kinase [Acidobacteriota bacterium]